LLSCSDSNLPKDITEEDLTASVEQEEIDECEKRFLELDTFPTINYKTLKIEDYAQFLEIKEKYGYSDSNMWANKAFITLNRMEMRFLKIGDSIVVPDTIVTDMRAYSVYPPYYCDAKHIPKLIMVSNKYQCYAAYENGVLVRFAAANTGKERTPTYPGRYALVWRDRIRKSSLDSTWVLPYTWNFHRYAGNAFHQFDMPGRAVSHSCIRQFLSDAKWLYSWGKGVKLDSNRNQIWLSGTPVVIQDMFDYDRKEGPWLDLANNKEGRIKLSGDPMEIEEALIPIKQIPEEIQGWIPNRKRYLYAEDTLRARGVIPDDVTLIESVNFNKRRREKKARQLKEAAEKAVLDSTNRVKSSTDMDVILRNLEELEGSK
ncbi:MAG: L,D-transpeptidase, partial [Candidatus Kapaibacterium sp.]